MKSDFGGIERWGAVSFTIGNKGYMGTGYATDFLKDFWEYDPATDTWAQKADFGGTARAMASGFSIGTKGYVGCGDDDNPVLYHGSKDFWEYDPVNNNWTRKIDFGGVPRRGAVGFNIESKGYMGTGRINDAGTPGFIFKFKDFWEYDPAIDIWTQKSDFGGEERAFASGFSIGNKGYVGTGRILTTFARDFWEYNPLTDTWSQKADFGGVERYGAVGMRIGSYGYIGTGITFPGLSNDFWEYNPVADSWIQKADFGGAGRYLASGFTVGDKGYIGTGQLNNVLFTNSKDFWEYTPSCVLVISSEPANQSVTYGSSVSFSVTANSAVSYQWQEDDGSGFINITDGGIYTNATNATLNISLPDVSMSSFRYRCVVAGNCLPTSVTSGNATLTVVSLPIVIIPVAGQVKEYGSPDPLTFTFSYAPALIGSDVLTGSIARVAGENVGTYAFTAGTLSAGSNYSFSVAATPAFSITPIAIIVTPDAGQAKEYGSADPPAFTFTYEPSLIGSDEITGMMNREPGENIGNYDFLSGSLGAGINYSLSLSGTSNFIITPVVTVKTLTLHIFLEGLFNGTTMNKSRNATGEQFPNNIADQITIELHSSISPFLIVGEPFTVDLTVNGEASVAVPVSFTDSYYVVVKHRNSIETWSATPVSLSGSTLDYNFTSSIGQAFGNNLKLISGKSVLFGGDIDQDGMIDATDLILIDNDASNFLNGYLTTDIDGNGSTNSDDLLIVSANASVFVARIVP